MVLQAWNPTAAPSQVEEQRKRPAPAEPAVSAETGILVRWQEQEAVSNATAVLNLHKVAWSLTLLCFDCFNLPDLVCDVLLWSRESKTEAKVAFVCRGSSGRSPSDLHEKLRVKDPAKKRACPKAEPTSCCLFADQLWLCFFLKILLQKFKHLCGVIYLQMIFNCWHQMGTDQTVYFSTNFPQSMLSSVFYRMHFAFNKHRHSLVKKHHSFLLLLLFHLQEEAPLQQLWLQENCRKGSLQLWFKGPGGGKRPHFLSV